MLRLLTQVSRRCYASVGRSSVSWLQHVRLSAVDSLDDVTLIGWLQSIRRHKDITFMNINDGSCASSLQIVMPTAAVPDDLTIGSCVHANGDLHNSRGRGQSVELRGKQISIVGRNAPLEHPLADGRHVKNETARQWLHLRPRLPSYAALWRLRHSFEKVLRNTYDSAGYFHVHTPLMTRADCEGAGESLSIVGSDVFFRATNKNGQSEDERIAKANDGNENVGSDGNVHLTVSSQLHLEAAACGLGQVYTLSPAWRGEKSQTRHHLVEFYMLEAESIDLYTEEAICDDVEQMLRSSTKDLLTKDFRDDFALLQMQFTDDNSSSEPMERIQRFSESSFLRMTFQQALNVLIDHSDRFTESVHKDTTDFAKEHERFLSNYVGKLPLFITNFPAIAKPFYCALSPDGNAKAVDLILPEVGEVMGGTVREANADVLKERMLEVGGETFLSNMQWYLDLRMYGCPPHGGYGIGFDRLFQYFAGIANIKDVVPFPRFYGSCKL